MTQPKPFISYEDWPKLTPFTEQAVRAYVHRGELVEGVHYFRRGRRVVFKWEACVAWIEGRLKADPAADIAADIAPVARRRA